jgi:hypothetical protein
MFARFLMCDLHFLVVMCIEHFVAAFVVFCSFAAAASYLV